MVGMQMESGDCWNGGGGDCRCRRAFRMRFGRFWLLQSQKQQIRDVAEFLLEQNL